MDKMELLTSFINRYRTLTFQEFALWGLFYFFLWVVLSLNEYSNQVQLESAPLYYKSWIDQFGWVFCFAFLSPFLPAVCHRWSIECSEIISTLIKLILFYLPFKAVYVSLVLFCKSFLYLVFVGEAFDPGPLVPIYLYQIVDSSPIYVAAVFVIYTIIYFQTAQREQINAAKLEIELQKTRMEVLRNQLQPHFMFNTLNLISSTMYRDVDKADSIITRLGDLLRYSLATEQKPFVSLKEEVQVMTSYLEIAKLRFSERMSTIIDIAPETKDIMIPAMLLQPLLENAVKYGIEPSDERGEISLTTLLENTQLIIKITNPWHQRRGQQESFGIGLNNTKKRLLLLYEDLASVSLENSNNQQVTLLIRLPIEQAKIS
jgi:two-component system LytT family sensor kinase